jgi:hypothetical protein
MANKILWKITKNVPFFREVLSAIETLNRIQSDLSVMRMVESNRAYTREMETSPRYKDPLRLPRYAFQVNSQNGEDGILQEIFRRIGTQTKLFVEVGVGNGAQNNTAFLLAQGWCGFWIDGNDAFLKTINKRDDLREWVTPRSAYITRENVPDIFSQLNIPKEFDLFSLDVDQNTFYIWEALYEYHPRVVLVEYNASIPPNVDWKVNYSPNRTWDGSQNFGASLKAYEILGRKLGYALVGCDFTGTNAFFVRNDLMADHFAAPFTAENHYESPKYGYVNWRGRRKTIILDRHTT